MKPSKLLTDTLLQSNLQTPFDCANLEAQIAFINGCRISLDSFSLEQFLSLSLNFMMLTLLNITG